MTAFNFVINYVGDVPKSAELYARILGLQPIEQSPGWAMFVVPGGPVLGPWARSGVKPAPTAAGGSELCFQVADDAAILRTRDEWAAAGATIIQEPLQLDFGLTFTATDLDGNRLRCMRANA